MIFRRNKCPLCNYKQIKPFEDCPRCGTNMLNLIENGLRGTN